MSGRYEQFGRQTIDRLGLSTGDVVLVAGTEGMCQLLQSILTAASDAGAHPLLVFVEDGGEMACRLEPESWSEDIDVLVHVTFDRRLCARSGLTVRWLDVLLPDDYNGEHGGRYLRALCSDWRRIEDRGTRLARGIGETFWIHQQDRKLKVVTRGTPHINSGNCRGSAMYSCIPAGVVTVDIGPLSVEGSMCFDVVKFNGNTYKDKVLEFADGRVSWFMGSMAVDSFLIELGINPDVTEVSGDLVLDRCRDGAVTVSLGTDYGQLLLYGQRGFIECQGGR